MICCETSRLWPLSAILHSRWTSHLQLLSVFWVHEHNVLQWKFYWCVCVYRHQNRLYFLKTSSLITWSFSCHHLWRQKKNQANKMNEKQAVLAFNLHSFQLGIRSFASKSQCNLGSPLHISVWLCNKWWWVRPEQDRSPLHPPLGTQELLKRIRLIATPHVFRTLTEGALLSCSQV